METMMFRFLTGGDEHILGLVMRSYDLEKFRESPLEDHVMIDGSQYEHPEVNILITYARSGTQARTWAKKKLHRNVAAGSLTFSGTSGQQKMIGIILTEPQMARFEAEPLGYYEIFEGQRYDVPDFKVLLTYSDNDRKLVRFMKELGVPYSAFANEPNLQPLWERFQAETLSHSLRLAKLAGRPIPEGGLVTLTVHDTVPTGLSETAILAARGQDLAWFRAHPNETEYLRPVVPGEFPADFQAEYTKVIQLPETEPGRSERLKIPMKRIGGEFVECTAMGDPAG